MVGGNIAGIKQEQAGGGTSQVVIPALPTTRARPGIPSSARSFDGAPSAIHQPLSSPSSAAHEASSTLRHILPALCADLRPSKAEVVTV